MHYIDSCELYVFFFYPVHTRCSDYVSPISTPLSQPLQDRKLNNQIAPAHLSLPNDKEPTTKICLSVLRWLENLLHSLDICDGFIEHS
jgi:hypothetical protein